MTATGKSIDYRYGFQGQEMDNDMSKGVTGAVYDYGFRIYDSRIAKFLSVDPLTASYPWYTPYQFAGNKPIEFLDLDGLEEIHYYYHGINFLTILNSEDTRLGQNEILHYVIKDSPNDVYQSEIPRILKTPDFIQQIIPAPPKDVDLVGVGVTAGFCVGAGSHGGFEIVVPTKGEDAFVPAVFTYEGRTKGFEIGVSAYYLAAKYLGKKGSKGLDFTDYNGYFRSINVYHR